MARRRKTYRSAQQVKLELGRDLQRVTDAALAALHREAHKAGLQEVERAAAPIESFRGTIRSVVGSTVRSPEAIDATTTRSAIGSTAKHWYALDFGRRRNHYRGGWTRLGGSEKVPRGMTKPASERFLARWPEIQQKAINAGERAL